MSKANKVGAAWVKEIDTKAGKQNILSVTIGEKRYTFFKNGFKEKPNQPDYNVFEDNYTPQEKQLPKQETLIVNNTLTDDGNDLPF
jgi:hypothetical protein